MKSYVLSEEEVFLFKGMVAQFYDWKEESSANTYSTELLLTNLNIVLSTDDSTAPQIYPAEQIKIYDEKFQIIRKKATVEIYLKSGELYLKFEQEKDARAFCDKSLRLRSGNSKFVRSVKKAQKAIKETNEALDIDIGKIVKTTASVACEIAATYSGNIESGKKLAGKVAGVIQKHAKASIANALLSSAQDAKE